MMVGRHPSEIELLEYVEGDLGVETLGSVRAHVETCSACAAAVAQLEQARRALRDSPLLELPAGRLQAVVAGLPRRERARPALLEFLSSPKRLAAVLVPVAAVVAVVVALTTGGGPGGGAGEAQRKGATAAAAAEAGAATAPAASAPTLDQALAPVATVAGPPKAVAKLLRDKGFDAKVVNGAVEVTSGKLAAVRKALEGRAPGPVPVIVREG